MEGPFRPQSKQWSPSTLLSIGPSVSTVVEPPVME